MALNIIQAEIESSLNPTLRVDSSCCIIPEVSLDFSIQEWNWQKIDFRAREVDRAIHLPHSFMG
jgi:hypothetical protein